MAFFIRTAWFQTTIAQKTAEYLTEELGTKVSIDKLEIIFFNRILIEGIYIEDSKNDTLLYSNHLSIKIADWSLKNSYINIEQVLLKDAYVKLKIYENDSVFNFQHILDYFGTSEEDDDESTSDFMVSVNKLLLENVNFLYSDYNIPRAENGMDFNHIDIQQLGGEFSNFSMSGNTIAIHLNQLKFFDKSGLQLRNLNAEVSYSSELLQLDNLNLQLNHTSINANSLKMITPNGSDDFNDFLNQVYFDVSFRNTTISLLDLSYIVPELWGMNDQITIISMDAKGPVNGMFLNNAEIKMLDTTYIKGNFQIPNLDDINTIAFSEDIEIIRTSIKDIEKLNLSPFLTDGEKYISIPSNLKGANVVEIKNTHFKGSLDDFETDFKIYSGLGNVYSESGLKFKNINGVYHYSGIVDNGMTKDIILENFNLGAIADNSMLGSSSGYIKIHKGSKGFNSKDMDVTISGNIQYLGLNNYDYKDIIIKNGRLKDDKFEGIIESSDPNIDFVFKGMVDFKNSNNIVFNFDLDNKNTNLVKLNFMEGNQNTSLSLRLYTKISGTSADKIKGEFSLADLNYFDGEKSFYLDTLSFSVTRGAKEDHFQLRSTYIDADLTGEFSMMNLYPLLKNQFAYILNNHIDEEKVPTNKNENFELVIKLKDINPILAYFSDDIFVEPNSQFISRYNSIDKNLFIEYKCQLIKYDGKVFTDITLRNRMDSVKATTYFVINHVKINDSISVRNFYVDAFFKDNQVFTNLGWDGVGQMKPALFAFNTQLTTKDDIIVEFSPSFFYLREEKWVINSFSSITYNPKYVVVDNLKLTNNKHYIKFNGKVSESPRDWLNFEIKDFNLADLNTFFGGEIVLGGELNMFGGVSDLYNNIRFMSMSDIKNFSLNEQEVGDIMLDSKWNRENNSVNVLGNLKRDGKETFKFWGDYFIDKEKENIDLTLKFDNTDIGFLNAFSDPDLYTGIEGILQGNLKVTGEIENPLVKGDINIVSAKLKVPMFGVDFGLKGKITLEDGAIYAPGIKLFDQEGNMGFVSLSVNHDNWSNIIYDVTLDLSDPAVTQTFLVMNTKFKEGDYYYGKAYITGSVNIFGYEDITNITVDARTKKGTDIVLPLYGNSELTEDNMIDFDPPYEPGDEKYDPNDTINSIVISKNVTDIEKMGMTLNMKFTVTNSAKITLVFDPILNDQIVATGTGNIEINMDNYGEMTMFGKYEIDKGTYNFNMKNVVKEDFEIVSGSTVVWTQSPYDANIDISTRFLRTDVNMKDIMAAALSDKPEKTEVYGYLNLSKTLMSPELVFDIQAPKASDEAKNALNNIRAVKDEVNKQFFSLLLFKKFISVEGASGTGGNNVASDLVNNQINSILDQVGDNYNLKTDITSEHAEFGFSTSFLDDKLKITTSVGVVAGNDGQSSGASNLVGDVNVEYELNDDGTFSFNVFNQSNQGSSSQDQGPFTQGAGVYYQEKFNTTEDFKLLQGFLNIFRSEEKKVEIKSSKNKNRNKVPVVENYDATLTNEEN